MNVNDLNLLSNHYTIGSHMYGLNTPDSDKDTLVIYFDKQDYLRPFRKLPEVKELNGNDTKVYSLDYFAQLVVKGNPNLVEVSMLAPDHERSVLVSRYLGLLRDNPDAFVHRGIVSAYMGHLTGIQQELKSKGVTPKRLSHALRICFTLNGILTTHELYSLKKDRGAQAQCLAVKLGTFGATYGLDPEEYVKGAIGAVEAGYQLDKDTFPTNEALKDLTNQFFEEIYV